MLSALLLDGRLDVRNHRPCVAVAVHLDQHVCPGLQQPVGLPVVLGYLLLPRTDSTVSAAAQKGPTLDTALLVTHEQTQQPGLPFPLGADLDFVLIVVGALHEPRLDRLQWAAISWGGHQLLV